MNKQFTILFLGILLISMVSAVTPLEEFTNSWDLEVTINPDNSTAIFNLDLEGTSFDSQDFTYGDFSVNNIYLSSLFYPNCVST